MDDLTRNQRRIAGSDPNPEYAGMTVAERAREKELERVAESLSLRIEKDVTRTGLRRYQLVDMKSGTVVAGDEYTWTLDEIEKRLHSPKG